MKRTETQNHSCSGSHMKKFFKGKPKQVRTIDCLWCSRSTLHQIPTSATSTALAELCTSSEVSWLKMSIGTQLFSESRELLSRFGYGAANTNIYKICLSLCVDHAEIRLNLCSHLKLLSSNVWSLISNALESWMAAMVQATTLHEPHQAGYP